MPNTPEEIEDARSTNLFSIYCKNLRTYKTTTFSNIIEALDDPTRQLTPNQIKAIEGLARRCKLRNAEITARRNQT